MPPSSARCSLGWPPAAIPSEPRRGIWPLAAGLLLLMTSFTRAQTPLRVACVGDSITYGDQIADRERDAYPALLQQLSGNRFTVGNFGVNGTTALRPTFCAWTDTAACQDALAFAPDLVVVMLGINDLAYPALFSSYPGDLRELVVRFQRLPSAPRVFLCTLTPIAPAELQAAVNRTIREAMNPAIRNVAADTGAQVIDISAAFSNRDDLLPDGLHPSPAGAGLIARTVFAALADPPPPRIRAAPLAGPVDVSIRNEARAARSRAEPWLQQHGEGPEAGTADPEAAADLDVLLPLLAGEDLPGDGSLFAAYARLAAALAARGGETVFLADDRPVAWRTALLHQLVQRQRIDSAGAGFWRDSTAPADDLPATARATAAALRALDLALGPN